jgi:hypothetical protein
MTSEVPLASDTGTPILGTKSSESLVGMVYQMNHCSVNLGSSNKAKSVMTSTSSTTYSASATGLGSETSMFKFLSQDVLLSIVSFLWVHDSVAFQSCTKGYRELVASNKVFQNILKKCFKKTGRHVIGEVCDRISYGRCISLLRSLSPFPFRVDYRSVFRNKKFKLGESAPGYFDRLSYTGRLGSNNVVFGNDHFPILPVDKRLRKFAKTVVTNSDECIPFLSLVAYFEVDVDVRAANMSIPEEFQHQDVAPCIAVGVATLRFPTNGTMPGWDENSFGFHGDDGHYFHGRAFGQQFCRSKLEYEFVSSEHGSLPRTASSSVFNCRFGPGDTVGCGIVYPPLTKHLFPEVFFTLNGRFLGKKKIYVPLQLPFFPVVGCDCYHSFRFNFNSSTKCAPFKFDVVKYERFRVEKKYPPSLAPVAEPKPKRLSDYDYFDDPMNNSSVVADDSHLVVSVAILLLSTE